MEKGKETADRETPPPDGVESKSASSAVPPDVPQDVDDQDLDDLDGNYLKVTLRLTAAYTDPTG